MNFRTAFRFADDVLCQGVQGISEIITKPGEVNIDFADMKSVMQNQGDAILGVGSAEGEKRAVEAAQKAISNPMLDNRHIDGARNILINITSSDDLAMNEIQELIDTVTITAGPNYRVYWGQMIDPNMGNRVSVTVIATGFEQTEEDAARARIEKEREANSNVVDLSDFDSIMAGRPAAPKQKANQEDEDGKFSTVSVDASEVFKDSLPEEEQALLDSLKRLPRTQSSVRLNPPPTVTVNPDDMQQPAIWRKTKRHLTHGIDLSSFE